MFHVKHYDANADNSARINEEVACSLDARGAFAAEYDVSRETMAAFDHYAALLTDWQTRMNLVGRATVPDIWTRHFADSAQLAVLAAPGSWLDIGAGAGFPGVVVALLGAGPVHLVESIEKKCAFLRAVVAALGLGERVIVHRSRIEALAGIRVATITARACAGLPQLFDWGLRFSGPETRWLLPKGASAAQEVVSARQSFVFDAELLASRTDPAARIVVAHDVRRR